MSTPAYNRKFEQLQPDDKNLAGLRVGSMVVQLLYAIENGYDKWLVRCDCGRESIKDGRNLRYGKQKSCGHMCPFNPRTNRKT